MKKLNIALIGYGKMGKEIEKIAIQRGHSINLKIDKNNFEDFNQINLEKIDVCIEFTQPKSVVENILKCFNYDVPIVTGTTGWNEKFDEISKKCFSEQKSLFFGSNFSIGVNIFFEINKKLAELMNLHLDYEIYMTEIHHTQKLDSPSGTAISLANQIIEKIERKKSWKEAENVAEDEIKITAIREKDVTGTHIINYSNEIDEIEIKHSAKNRKGFALGAVLAAEFIVGKSGVYTMKDLLNL